MATKQEYARLPLLPTLIERSMNAVSASATYAQGLPKQGDWTSVAGKRLVGNFVGCVRAKDLTCIALSAADGSIEGAAT